MTLARIEQAAALHRLSVLGGFLTEAADGLPDTIGTLLLFGPAEPGFWAHLTATPEWQDTRPDPIDRWSRRVIGGMACDLGGKAYFPFGGAPYHPFYQWALRSGRAWVSPVTLLVHDQAGLFLSYRGAIGLRERLDLPPPKASPCETCADRPCLAACPPRAPCRSCRTRSSR